ncbi:MAG: dTMP kinase [Aeriscardovia sp.]|nr:dTMP kinase [Aeriscardovia sp.]
MSDNKRKYPGLFITFEGVDGAGKTTQAVKLQQYLEQDCKVPSELTKEPGGTALGKAIRQLLLTTPEEGAPRIDERAEALLYAADRSEHISEFVYPRLCKGIIVISDRYIDSSIAYQSGGRELNEAAIEGLSDWATKGLQADRTYLLDIDPTSARSRFETTRVSDRLESEPEPFQDRTRQEFLNLAKNHSDRIVVIDASQDIDNVWQQIKTDIDRLLQHYKEC